MNFPTVLFALAILFGPLLTSAHTQTPAQMSANEYTKGRAYLEAKNYARAIEHLNKSMRPDQASMYLLALSYANTGRKLCQRAAGSIKQSEVACYLSVYKGEEK